MDPEALEAMCDLFQARPETLLIKQSRQYAQCCMEPYVEEEFAFCGQEISFGVGEPIEVNQIQIFLTVIYELLCGKLIKMRLKIIFLSH